MHPIEEFDFTSIDKKLALKFIRIHNSIYQDLFELKLVVKETESKSYLDIFLTQFKQLDDKNETLVFDTIICCSKAKLDIIPKLTSKITLQTNEIIACRQLIKLTYYASLKKKESVLDSLAVRDKDQEKDLNKTRDKLNASIKLKSLLQKIFNYMERRKYLLQYYALKNYRVCSYCLAQYTSIYRSNTKSVFFLTGNLDHIEAKSKNPYLSVSINNLVPVCAHCNQRKNDKKFKYNPFNSKHKHRFDFTNCIDIDPLTSEIVLKSLDELEILPNKGSFNDLAKKLDFKDLYKNFSSNAQFLIDRYQKFHSKGYHEHLEKITKKTNSRDFIEYFISEVPLVNGSILQHPLTKFKIDLFKAIKDKSSTT